MKLKKWTALALAGVMALSLMACSSGTPDPTQAPDPTEKPAESTPVETQAPGGEEKKPEDYTGELTI